ncbi:MAG: lyase family protein [Patescibacteria group bacterium]
MSLNLMMPGFPKYQPRDLQEYFGYDNLFREFGNVEFATLLTLGDIGVIPPNDIALLTPEVMEKILAIPTTEVVKIEREITKHDIRAWIYLANQILPEPLRKWLHILLTSYDPLDTSRILQFLKAYQHVVDPKLRQVMAIFVSLIERYARTLQIGRTHGQHAIPITVGFWLATILNRVFTNAKKMELFSHELVGKISGAVGAYNAQVGLGIEARCGEFTFERRVLERLGLMPAVISSQILQPEPLAYFLFAATMTSASFGQLGRDCRQLMRTEIAEIGEPFSAEQSGSSTMAQKRNPINFEHVEGLHIDTKNEFGKVQDTLISDHQRDLVGSPVARKFPTILINLTCQLDTLLRKDPETGRPFLERMTVNEEACQRNFNMSAHTIMAEPLYIALQMAGFQGDAHKLVNHTLVPVATRDHRYLIDTTIGLAQDNPDLAEALKRIPTEVIDLLKHPETYIGKAPAKALEIANAVKTYLG